MQPFSNHSVDSTPSPSPVTTHAPNNPTPSGQLPIKFRPPTTLVSTKQSYEHQYSHGTGNRDRIRATAWPRRTTKCRIAHQTKTRNKSIRTQRKLNPQSLEVISSPPPPLHTIPNHENHRHHPRSRPKYALQLPLQFIHPHQKQT